jgi:hypothetical protein
MPVHIVAKRDASDDLSAGGNGQMRQMDGGVFCFPLPPRASLKLAAPNCNAGAVAVLCLIQQ